MRAYDTLHSLLLACVTDMGLTLPEKLTIEPPKDERHGDLATNVAMVLAKQAGRPPRELAQALADAIAARSADVARVDIAGPGFLNVTFTPAFWQATVAQALAAGEAFGRTDTGRGRRVQVEYVSANPTGPLHIGHGRGAAVGDSLARVLRAAGYDTQTEYYINDAGRQMLILGQSVWYRMQALLGREVPEPEDYYRGDYIIGIARELLEEKGRPFFEAAGEDAAVDACREKAMADILAGIRKDLEEFGVEHQVWFSERSLLERGAVDSAFEHLRARGLAFDQDGAFWFRSTQYGDDKDRVLRKSDGLLTYFASDIAYHHDKYERGFDMVVDIWGADHHGYVPRMKAAVQALGREADDLQVILVQLVNLLRGGEQVAMSTRAGEFETLADVVHEVGADAARFMFLSRKSDSPLDFDLELVKQQSMDNPVYYVQYAHARIHSILRKAAERGVAPGAADAAALAPLTAAEDLRLAKLVEQFPDTVAAAAANLAPHHVSHYLMTLAGALHSYYHSTRILGEAPEVERARLLLLTAVAGVIHAGLGLLGVSAPQSM